MTVPVAIVIPMIAIFRDYGFPIFRDYGFSILRLPPSLLPFLFLEVRLLRRGALGEKGRGGGRGSGWPQNSLLNCWPQLLSLALLLLLLVLLLLSLLIIENHRGS